MKSEQTVLEHAEPDNAVLEKSPPTAALPRVLFVDDEVNVLQGIRRQLRREYDVTVATSGAEGLAIIAAAEQPFPVVVSDMRMPQMDGAQFLAKVRVCSPDTLRVILTGQADIESTIQAVNKGQIFRFLTKPCDADSLKAVLKAGHEQHRLRRVEKDLLENTVSGAVKTLTEILALANPVAGGQTARIGSYVDHMLQTLEMDSWEIRLAAMLSQVGCVTMPRETLDKINAGQAISSEEQQLFNAHYQVAGSLIRAIPRLEKVADIVEQQSGEIDDAVAVNDSVDVIAAGALLVRLATEFDAAVTRGATPPVAVHEVTQAHSALTDGLRSAVAGLASVPTTGTQPLLVGVNKLAVGMVLDQDLLAQNGVCLCSAGQAVSGALLQRIRTIAERIGVVEPFRVLVPNRIAGEYE